MHKAWEYKGDLYLRGVSGGGEQMHNSVRI